MKTLAFKKRNIKWQGQNSVDTVLLWVLARVMNKARKQTSSESLLAPELRGLVSYAVGRLGQLIERELGSSAYQLTEKIRGEMAALRKQKPDVAFAQLKKTYADIEKLKSGERRSLATSFTLMLEVMNACENAYRSHRLNLARPVVIEGEKPQAIIYVLTAHPTEARAPQNIAVFHQIQNLLIKILDENESKVSRSRERELDHLLEIAWRAPIVRDRAPRVKDEAEHIYSTALRDDVLGQLLEIGENVVPFFLRSWVGGDKDGHPGVDEKAMIESLTLSRGEILRNCAKQLQSIRATLDLMRGDETKRRLEKHIVGCEKRLKPLRKLSAGDGRRITQLKDELIALRVDYEKSIGIAHPCMRTLRQVFRVFPGLVVPLELRESSDILKAKSTGKKIAIERMLTTLAKLSKGYDPRWYARGFIISMCGSIEDIRAAAGKQMQAFGALRLPIVPLFEEAPSLVRSPSIVTEMLTDRKLRKAVDQYWNGQVELMVGYSDSSKESGVLTSRLTIAETLPKLEKVCESFAVTPVFFHGSGGSIDRGGGSIEDQTAWWPRSALRTYKVTVQGEMVERSFASPAITRRQVTHILESVTAGLKKKTDFTTRPALDAFTARIAESYKNQIENPKFLALVEKVTPYSYLNLLKIGSRPTKRSSQLAVSGLRAIPWILCWTQTRVLFPTWWGVGSSWKSTSESDRKLLRDAFRDEPVFTSYVKALGFTLAKIEMPVWRMYLETSVLSVEEREAAFKLFNDEYERALRFYKELTGESELLWFRPWLQESILLRSPMIHPLNLLQILSEKSKDAHLLRVSVTGISSGMMTTG